MDEMSTLETVKQIIENESIQKLSRKALEEFTIKKICETFDQHNKLSKLTSELQIKDFANDSMKRQHAKLRLKISLLTDAIRGIASEVSNLKTTTKVIPGKFKSVGVQVNEEAASVLSECTPELSQQATTTMIRDIGIAPTPTCINTNTQSGTSELMPPPPPPTPATTFVSSASARSTGESTLPKNNNIKKTRVNLISASRSENILQTDIVQEGSNNLSVQDTERQNVVHVTESISVPPPDQGTSVQNVSRSYKRPSYSSSVNTRKSTGKARTRASRTNLPVPQTVAAVPADLRTPMESFLGRHGTSSNLKVVDMPSTSRTTAAMEPEFGLMGKPIQIIRGRYVTIETCPEAFIPRPMMPNRTIGPPPIPPVQQNRPTVEPENVDTLTRTTRSSKTLAIIQPTTNLDTPVSTGDCSYQQAMSSPVGITRTRIPMLTARFTVPAPRHPAPLPGPPEVQPSQPSWKLMPPKLSLKINSVPEGIVLVWRILNKDLTLYEEIASYQLYAYRVTNTPPSTDMWREVGEVKALTLPMACTLARSTTGNNFYFAVRAVDVKSRIGPFSTPEHINLPPH